MIGTSLFQNVFNSNSHWVAFYKEVRKLKKIKKRERDEIIENFLKLSKSFRTRDDSNFEEGIVTNVFQKMFFGPTIVGIFFLVIGSYLI